MTYNTILLLCFFLIALQFLQLFQQKWFQALFSNKRSSSKTPKPQVMWPKTEKDCPECRARLTAGLSPARSCKHLPKPWSQIKSKRGKKKTIRTQNYFCPNQDCYYYLVTDQNIHALVGDGKHGLHKDIQDFRCQACRSKFSCRKFTVLYHLKKSSKIVCLCLALLAAGIDTHALADALEISEVTLRNWLSRSGEHGRKLHNRFVTNLELAHLQLDELRANVKHAQEVWVWTICDAKTKLIPVVQLGPRTQTMAYAMVHELITRLKAGCVPVFSSDGLKHYYYALTAHFGQWVCVDGHSKPVWMLLPDFVYGQVIKHRKRLRIVDIEQRLLWGLPQDYCARLKAAGLSGNINTSFVERANLTIRQSISKLSRQSWATAHYPSELCEHLFWWLAYYHFARYHQSLRIKLAQPRQRKGKQLPIQYRQTTPAMAAGITRQRWSIMELLSYPLL